MYEHIFLFPLGTNLWLEWLGYVISIYLTFLETAPNFPIHQKGMRVPVAPHLLHHHLVCQYFYFSYSVCVVAFQCGMMCILFMCLLVIHTSPLLKCLSKMFLSILLGFLPYYWVLEACLFIFFIQDTNLCIHVFVALFFIVSFKEQKS